jgi:hypothetical protein
MNANAQKHPLGRWTLDEGYISAAIRGRGANSMAKGSKNGMITGDGFVRGYRGSTVQVGKVGSRVFFITDESYAGLGTLAAQGVGSVFKVRGILLYIGEGQVAYDGQALAGINASSTLSYIRKVGGVFDVTHEYQAGHAQPSAPALFAKDIPSAGQIAMSFAGSVVIWRVCSITGQTSLMSLPSNVVTFSGQSAIVQIPLPDNNGQDIWGIGVPKIGFADVGNYYELPTSSGGEVLEADIGYTRAPGTMTSTVRGLTNASNTTPIVITDNGHPFLTGDQVTIAGVTGNTAANGTWIVTKIDANTYSLDGSIGNGAYAAGGSAGSNIVTAPAAEALTNATNATPIVITSAGHVRVTGNRVIISGVTGNTAANGEWIVTKIDANTYSLNGSAGNGAYAAGGSAGSFVSTDVGRRLSFSTFDSSITEIVTATRVRMSDTNATAATITGVSTVAHAIDGILRAVEISWANGYLLEQNLAPDRAFPPVAAAFAGALNDVLFVDADGIIYIGDPNTTGSFPPKNALFASSNAVLYLHADDGVILRFMKNAIGALYYVGGSPAAQYYEFRKHQGLKYAQNAGNGFNARVCAWLGRPCVITDSLEPDFTYANKVMPDFDGWNLQQTANKPIVFGYDGLGQYECWCFGKIVMAKFAPTGAWCSPTDLTDELPGNIVAAVTVNHALYLSVEAGGAAKASTQIGVSALNATVGDTLHVGGKVYTFVAGAPGANEIQIGGDKDATAANIAAQINIDTATCLCVAVVVADPPPPFSPDPEAGRTINLTANTAGVAGNAITLSTTSAHLFVSAFAGGADASLGLYQYDAGNGSVMVIQVDDYPSQGSFDTVTEVQVRGRVDNVNSPVVIEVINTFDDANPEADPWDGEAEQTPTAVGTQFFTPRRPNVLQARAHAIRITMTGEGGDIGPDFIETAGATSGIIL